MKKLFKYLSNTRHFGYAALLYTALLAYDMGEAFFHPSTTLDSGPFDHTVLMWLYSTSPNTPWWGYSSWSNFPVGEEIWNPIHVIGQTFYIPFWFVAKLVGPIAAYNILIGLGTLTTAVVGFAFVRWLLNKKSFFVPFVAGFIMAFTPYMLIKSMVHPSYAFGGIIIGIIWSLLIYLRKPSNKGILLIGLLSGVILYTDIYFILYLLVILVSGALTVLILKVRDKNFINTKLLVRHIILYGLIIAVFLTPLIITKLTSSQKISNTLTDARSSKWEEAYAYGARPWEYLLPSAYNPMTPNRVRNFEGNHLHGSAYRETNLYLGLTVIVLAATWIVLNLKLNKTKFVQEHKRTSLFIGVVLILSLLFSMTPKLVFKGITIYFPSYFITSLTGYWRVLARLTLVVQISLGVLAALGLYSIISSGKFPQEKFKRALLLSLIFLLIFTDFLIFKPFKRYVWTQANIPSVYTTIKNEKDISAIAEYPMIDPPRNFHFIYYATYQMYHKKPIVDAIIIGGNNNKTFRAAIMNIKSNWQSTKVLKSMGVSYFVIHDKSDPGSIPGASLLSSGYDIAADNTAWLYKINSLDTLGCVTIPSNGFDGPSAYDYKDDVQYYMHGTAEIQLKPIPKSSKDCNSPKQLSLEFYTFEKRTRDLKVFQEGRLLWEGNSYGYEQRQILKLTVDPAKPIKLQSQDPQKDFSLVVSNMIAN